MNPTMERQRKQTPCCQAHLPFPSPALLLLALPRSTLHHESRLKTGPLLCLIIAVGGRWFTQCSELPNFRNTSSN